MVALKTSLFLAVIALAISGTYVRGGIFDDIAQGASNFAQGISNLACITPHISEFRDCYNKIKDAYQTLDYNNVQKDDLKDACCSYVAYRDCVEAVAYKRCGSDAAKTAEYFMNSIKGASTACKDYNNIFDCMDPVVLIAVIVVLAIVGIAILACLVRICQSCCRC